MPDRAVDELIAPFSGSAWVSVVPANAGKNWIIHPPYGRVEVKKRSSPPFWEQSPALV